MKTETAHFMLVYPRRNESIPLKLAPRAEKIFQEYKEKIGTAPVHKITIFFNDNDEIISGIRAQNTDADYSIWTGNPLTPPSYSGTYTLNKALRVEIAYAFQESVSSFPINYWYYVFSRPFKSPWSDSFISYLVSPPKTALEVSALRYFQQSEQADVKKTSPLEEAYRITRGRSQIRYFENIFQGETLKRMYTSRQSIAGIPYFDFNSAFEQTTGISYDVFDSQWKKTVRRTIKEDKLALNSESESNGTPLLKPKEVLAYRGAAIDKKGNMIAAVVFPRSGSYLQKLLVMPLEKGTSGNNKSKIISRGYFQSQMDWSAAQNKLAFTKRMYDSKKGNYYHQLYTWSADNGKIRQVTDRQNVGLPCFSTDGKSLLYVEKNATRNIVWIQDLNTGFRKNLYVFAPPVSVTQIDLNPRQPLVLISYQGGDGNYKAGIFDMNKKVFSPSSLSTDVPLNTHWGPDGKAIFFNDEYHKVPNIFKAEVTGTAVSDGVPISTEFTGATLLDVAAGATGEAFLLANTGDSLSLYSEKSGDHSARILKLGRNNESHFFDESNHTPETGSDLSRTPYHAYANIKWEPPFVIPYYINSVDFGFGGYFNLVEPMRTHKVELLGIFSVADPWGKSFFYSHYTNNSLKPRIKVNFNHFPSASGFFGKSRKEKTSNVLALTSLWRLSRNRPNFTTWYVGLTLRYLGLDYFSQATLLKHHPTVFLNNQKTRQTDLKVALIRRNLEPSRHTLIHPLDGNGARLTITASDKILGSQSRYARISLDGYKILPAFGDHRIYLYGNGAVDVGEPVGDDYLAFTDTGEYQLPGPAFMGSVNPGLRKFLRGYKSPVLGNRFIFGKIEYRIPFWFNTTHRFLGILPPARTSFTLFFDGGVMGDARVTATREKTIYRYSGGAEIKHVFGFGANFKLTGEAGIAQALNHSFEPIPYVNVKTAIPF